MSCCAPSFSRQTNPIKHCGFTIPAGLIKHAVNLYKIKAGVISTLAHCSRLLERRACKSRRGRRFPLEWVCLPYRGVINHSGRHNTSSLLLLSQSPITSIRAPRALRAASLLNDRISRDGARALPPAVRQAEEAPVNLGTLGAWTTAQRCCAEKETEWHGMWMEERSASDRLSDPERRTETMSFYTSVQANLSYYL